MYTCTLQLLLLGMGDENSINVADIHGNTPLHLACSNGHEECVKALLFHKGQCSVSPTNNQGDTPLHNAARWGYGESSNIRYHTLSRSLPQSLSPSVL